MIFDKTIFALAFLALLVCSTQPADGQTDLKWNLKKGDQLQATLIQSSATLTKVDSRETSVTSSTTILFDWNVTDVDSDGTATIEQSLASIKLSVTDPAVPEQAVSYDTSSQEKPSKVSQKLLKQVMPLIGLKFNVEMSSRGEIADVKIPDETRELLNQLPETLKLRALFSEQGLRDILGASAIVLPAEKISAGESWSQESETTSAFGKFNRKRTYTFVGTKTIDGQEIAEFSLEATLEPLEEESGDADRGLRGELVDFSGSGQLLLDVQEGFFSSSKIQNEVKSEKPYREKKIVTTVNNQIEVSIRKN